MMTTLPELVVRLRRPEYTGENRCIPCTIVNLTIAIIVAGSVTTIASVYLGFVLGVLLGGVLFLVFAATVYLRGYLIPGTPQFTKTHFPDWLLRQFDKHPSARREVHDGDIDVDIELKRANALTECEHEDDLCLTEEFHTAWRERIVNLREDDTARTDLSTVLDIDADRLTLEEHGNAFVAHLDNRRVGQWESRAAFLADMAGAQELRRRLDTWSNIDVGERGRLLNGLRIFIEQCPVCDSPVAIDQEVVESCCRSIDVVAVTCQSCDSRIFEAEQPN